MDKKEAEVELLKKQVESTHAQINSLQSELEEKQRYLMNCWDEIRKLESIYGKDVSAAKVQTKPNKNREYNICKACDRDVQYCICAR